MEEQTTPSPEYLKGFNEGYMLAKEAPELADKLSHVKSDTERLQGLQDGRKQYVLEKVREMRPRRMSDHSNLKTDKEKDNSKDKDRDIDYER